MKNQATKTHRRPPVKGRPDYYITPTRDFTQYTRDCEEKYWRKETAFDWRLDVRSGLKEHLDSLNPEHLSKVAFMVFPMILETISRKIIQIRQTQLPLEEDALKDIGECVPSDKTTIQQAIALLLPLQQMAASVSALKDRREILQSELLDVKEQHRLGLFRTETAVKQLETEEERADQQLDLSRRTRELAQVEEQFHQLKAQYKTEIKQLKTNIRTALQALEPQILLDLEETRQLLQETIQAGKLPDNPEVLSRLKDLIQKRQIRGLKDIANHALVVEQSAIAPLSVGIIHYKRYREIQEALTTFINDEAKHSATFRRFLAEKLEAKEFISDLLIKGTDRYMWLARFMPGSGMFLAVIIEAIGAAYLEFFSKEAYMPDPLFCSICKTISQQDEIRHMDLCVDMYNELFRTGTNWERIRNKAALKVMMKAVYGDKDEDHHLIQAFRAFGVESEYLYRHIVERLSQQLARIGLYVAPERLLEYIGSK